MMRRLLSLCWWRGHSSKRAANPAFIICTRCKRVVHLFPDAAWEQVDRDCVQITLREIPSDRHMRVRPGIRLPL